MTIFESGESNGSVALSELFGEQKDIAAKSSIDIRDLAYLICRGGWPKAHGQTEKNALRQAYDYYDAVVESDITAVDGINRNPQRVKLLMRSFSRFIASDAKISNIRKDMVSNDLDSLDEDTIYSYITALKRIFVVEDLPEWSPNLRSKTAIRTSDTRHFVDPSGLECDAVVHLRNGSYALIEI